ncbi:MAG: hypothetical protein KDI09_13300 [Halioglobus sp.]|nr:hypothetical protein [Halioglobus sp.]
MKDNKTPTNNVLIINLGYGNDACHALKHLKTGKKAVALYTLFPTATKATDEYK